jgi:shikimate kinase
VIRRNIVLVGFMGTGKTFVGKLLAERLGWRFVDSDHWIELRQNQTIPEIFRDHGEAIFRKLETQALVEILAGKDQIIATGGGAVLAAENREAMLANGFVIALTASPEEIILRVGRDQNRPLLQGNAEERVHAIMEQRKHAYDFANFYLDTMNLSPRAIVDAIIEASGIEKK